MSFVLRPYQVKLKQDVYIAWNAGFKNVLAVCPTGGGKTVIVCDIVLDMAVNPQGPRLPTAIQVHRKELVEQISLTLARAGIVHNIIAPTSVISGIVAAHRKEYRRSFYDYKAPVSVVSVDTLNARAKHHAQWMKTIKLWITDEAAHVLKENKWGRAIANFPNAIGLGVTATPKRLDRRGLGSDTDGVFDTMVMGPTTKWMIDNGFLCNYFVIAPPSDYSQFLKEAKGDSDYSKEALTYASLHSHIVGDVVENYLKFARGKQAIVFTSDIESGQRMEREFAAKGVKAKLLTGETPDAERRKALWDYRDKKIQVLINIDLFDEGLDVPGIEVVIMARKTKSIGKYLQCVGRGLRPFPGKDRLLLIDHVRNVKDLRLPCARRKWSLERGVKRQDKTNLVRICKNYMCSAVFDRILTECPYCGHKDVRPPGEGGGRPTPEQVDGDLALLDPETIRGMEAEAILDDPAFVNQKVSFAAGPAAGAAAMKHQRERIEQQKNLAETIAKWAGPYCRHGYTDREIHKAFYLKHGMMIIQALSMKRAEMESLEKEIKYDMDLE